MADYNAYLWPIFEGTLDLFNVDDRDEYLLVPGLDQNTVSRTWYSMRALSDPGPGYVTWQVPDSPDPTGASAPSSIIADSAVIAGTWGESSVVYSGA